jgi:hypothetical protein
MIRTTFRRVLRASFALAISVAAPAYAEAPSATPIQMSAPAAPEALDAARPVTEKLFPTGTYRKLMGATMDRMLGGMIDGMMRLPLGQLARAANVPEAKVTNLDKATLGEVATLMDPYFKERTTLGTRAMMDSMIGIMSDYEPRVRDAMTRAYARKFTPAQLHELNSFFETPTGNLYASQVMTVYTDPEMIDAMQSLMPDLMRRMPEFVGVMTKATAKLPKPKTYQDLTPAERERLSKLLGLNEKPASSDGKQ